MKKYRKSIWLPVALLVYTTAMAVYFIPRNTEISDTEKYLTVGLSYMIIALLWIVLRKKEKAEERRERDLENKKITIKRQHYEENLVSLMLLVMTALSAHAQFEKEVWYVNASLTGLDLSHSKNEGTNFGFALTGGAFVADNVAVLLNLRAIM